MPPRSPRPATYRAHKNKASAGQSGASSGRRPLPRSGQASRERKRRSKASSLLMYRPTKARNAAHPNSGLLGSAWGARLSKRSQSSSRPRTKYGRKKPACTDRDPSRSSSVYATMVPMARAMTACISRRNTSKSGEVSLHTSKQRKYHSGSICATLKRNLKTSMLAMTARSPVPTTTGPAVDTASRSSRRPERAPEHAAPEARQKRGMWKKRAFCTAVLGPRTRLCSSFPLLSIMLARCPVTTSTDARNFALSR
mmetsp:Transcript_110214/g.322560  ORF Transcript_110214/g.322560 Transcript_110214/m.322560 type:complete len:254 (+) Transcript_110214:390-1151(+)